MIKLLFLNAYTKIAALSVICLGAYYGGSFIAKHYKQWKYEKKIEKNYKKRLDKKDDIDAFQIDIGK